MDQDEICFLSQVLSSHLPHDGKTHLSSGHLLSLGVDYHHQTDIYTRIVEIRAQSEQRIEGNESSEKSQVRSVIRALEILSCFTPAKPTASLTEIARSSGLAITTAGRLLATLESARFIRRHADGDYGLGTRVLQFGLTALSTSLYQAAEPHLQVIANATGETANLGVLNEVGSVMYLRQIESRQAIRHAAWIGRSVPTKGTAIGAAILGHVNSDGFTATRSTIEPDVTAIAAPVYGGLGQIVAALSVTGPSYRISDHQIAEYGKCVRDEAQKMRIALWGN